MPAAGANTLPWGAASGWRWSGENHPQHCGVHTFREVATTLAAGEHGFVDAGVAAQRQKVGATMAIRPHALRPRPVVCSGDISLFSRSVGAERLGEQVFERASHRPCEAVAGGGGSVGSGFVALLLAGGWGVRLRLSHARRRACSVALRRAWAAMLKTSR